MSNIRTPTAKGGELIVSEAEDNHKRAAQAKSSNYTIAYTDNRDTIECTSGITVTFPDIATLLSNSEIGDFSVTIAVADGQNVTVALTTVTDTIDGYAGSVTLPGYSRKTFKINEAGTGLITIAESNLVPNKNHFYNGNFQHWQRGTTDSSPATSTSDVYLADRWYVRSSGADLGSIDQSSTVPSTGKSRYSLELTGAASVTTVKVGQRIEAADTYALAGTITVQFYVYNGSGAAFTPNLLIGTADSEDDFSAVINRLTQSLSSCSNGAWTKVTHSVDISGYTNLNNGLQIEVQIPSGSLVSGDTVRIAEAKIEPGSVATDFVTAGASASDEEMLCKRFCRKTFPRGTAPAQNAGLSGSYGWIVPVTNQAKREHIFFDVPMRTSSWSITFYNPSAANANWSASGVTASALNKSDTGFDISHASPPTISGGSADSIHFLIEDEL